MKRTIKPKYRRLFELVKKREELKVLKRRKAEIEARDRHREPNGLDTLTDPSRDNQ